MSPREHPPLPPAVAQLKKKLPTQDDADGADLAEAAERMNIGGDNAGEGNEDGEGVTEQIHGVINRRPEFVPPLIEGWEITPERPENVEERLMNCAMGCDGELIVGIGSKGSVWVWRQGDD
jgi:polycomb protein EED